MLGLFNKQSELNTSVLSDLNLNQIQVDCPWSLDSGKIIACAPKIRVGLNIPENTSICWVNELSLTRQYIIGRHATRFRNLKNANDTTFSNNSLVDAILIATMLSGPRQRYRLYMCFCYLTMETNKNQCIFVMLTLAHLYTRL